MSSDALSTFSRNRLRELLAPWRASRDLAALGLMMFDCAAFVALECIAIFARSFVLRAASAVLASLFISRLFILAHDACHGSLFSKRWMNQLAGRVGFLPSLTPYSLWEVGHNVVHHGFTNLKGRDWVWTPLTKREYDELSFVRRLMERVYRTAAGLGLYYMVELWWKRMIAPDRAYLPPKRTIFKKDLALVVAFAVVAVAAIWRLGGARGLLWGVVVPFACWTQTMGLVIYQHHTHPAIAWYDKRAEWNLNQIQVRNAIHVLFPGPFNVLLHNIMEHTAHHVDMAVPLRNLPGAQAELESKFPDDILVQRWSIGFFRKCLKTCKLYDYDSHRWLDFDGELTANVTSVHRLSTEGES
jgi:omega-6 fatty acid desaturase (delta-12 desaturase)